MKYAEYITKEQDMQKFNGLAYSIQLKQQEIDLLKKHLAESKAAPKESYTWYNGKYSHSLHLRICKLVIKETESQLQQLIQNFEKIA